MTSWQLILAYSQFGDSLNIFGENPRKISSECIADKGTQSAVGNHPAGPLSSLGHSLRGELQGSDEQRGICDLRTRQMSEEKGN